MSYTRPDPASPGHDLVPQSFWTRYVRSQGHKVITMQYSFMTTAVGLVGLVLSNLMWLQLGFPDKFDFTDANHYYQFVTMHGVIVVIHLLTALFLGGFGNYLVPLMPGARNMVSPSLNMLSYWARLLIVLVPVVSFFVPDGPTGASQTLYPPQAILPGMPGTGWGIMPMLVSLAIFIVAATMGGFNYMITTLQARTRGMTFMRTPLMVWDISTATVLVLLASLVLFVSTIMMLLDKTLDISFFILAVVSMGQQLDHSDGSPLLFQHLFWLSEYPKVYIVALSVFGIASDLISTRVRKNIFDYRMMMWAILTIDILSFVVWAYHILMAGMNPHFGFSLVTTTPIIAISTALKAYNWVLMLWRGDVHLTVPMLFAIGFISTFVIDRLTGLLLGNVSVDIPPSNMYFVVAHFHIVMGVSPILVVFGGFYHWHPKVTGRIPNGTLRRAYFWIIFTGTYLIHFPMYYLGVLDMPRRYYAYEGYSFIPSLVQAPNTLITIIAIIVGLVQLLFLFNLAWSPVHGREAETNP